MLEQYLLQPASIARRTELSTVLRIDEYDQEALLRSIRDRLVQWAQ